MKVSINLDNEQSDAIARIAAAYNLKERNFSADPEKYLDITPEDYFTMRALKIADDEVGGIRKSDAKAAAATLVGELLAASPTKRQAAFDAARVELERAGAEQPAAEASPKSVRA